MDRVEVRASGLLPCNQIEPICRAVSVRMICFLQVEQNVNLFTREI
ncbi:hypothetical protein [Porphyromonas sp. COT-108 OH2963]|nr:hypothetical protein [Porphyromonas sp. COT-108 OH2963]